MTSFRNATLRRVTALAVGAGTIGSLALAGPAVATAPNAGANCQPNGKVLGRGATFARNAHHQAFIPGYRLHVCGPVTDASGGTNMVLYNEHIATDPPDSPSWPAGTIGTSPRVGSGSGIAGNRCRAEAFEGTDIPYSLAQIRATRGPAPSTTDPACAALNNDDAFRPVYEPGAALKTFPAPGDTAAVSPVSGTSNGAMSFPIAGAAIAIGANLTSTECPGITGARPVMNLTGAQVSGIFGGMIRRWDDPALTGTSPDLARCVNVPVVRVVRSDSSGTSQQFRNYLAKADNAPAPNPRICDTAMSWPALKTGSNTVWPEPGPASATNCSGSGGGSLVRPDSAGGQALVRLTDTTIGGVGYADLADWQGAGVTISLSNVQAPTGGFVNPASGRASNCSFAGAQTPGSGTTGAVGLSPIDANWASDASVNRSDVTFVGSGYPVCAFTWVLVYSGLNGNNKTASDPISRLSDNQRRNLYSYMMYMLSPLAQQRLTGIGYAQLPPAFRDRFTSGFDANF